LSFANHLDDVESGVSVADLTTQIGLQHRMGFRDLLLGRRIGVCTPLLPTTHEDPYLGITD
jgi:hypothetical protein